MLVNVYATCREVPAPSFPHTLRNRRDRGDPELTPHLRGFIGFVTQRGTRPMTQTRYHVLRHLERVRHHLALEVDEAHAAAFSAWCREANGIVFLTDSTVRAPDGLVLVDPSTGDAQPGAEVPYPADAVRRKEKQQAMLAQLGISVPRSLPPVASELEVELRTPSEVASRCLALIACAVRAESLNDGDALSIAELRSKLPLAFDALSPKEQAFMASDSPPQQAIVDHAWRYEALAVLAWSIGVLPALPMATQICNVPALAKAMFALKGEKFLADARLRPTTELLDALDLHFRLHWATTDARVKKTTAPASLEPGVVSERHHALNWLTRFEDANWDDVTTPT